MEFRVRPQGSLCPFRSRLGRSVDPLILRERRQSPGECGRECAIDPLGGLLREHAYDPFGFIAPERVREPVDDRPATVTGATLRVGQVCDKVLGARNRNVHKPGGGVHFTIVAEAERSTHPWREGTGLPLGAPAAGR